jgi:hypothetical protein
LKLHRVLTGVFRVTDGVLNIGKSGLGAGISIAEGGVNVAKEMGTGALNVGKKLLGGLFDTGKGLATLDAKQVEKGLVGSTVGTIDLSLDAVGGAGSAAGGGVDKSVSDLTGSAAVQAWDKGIPERYQTAMQRGRKGSGENALSASNPMNRQERLPGQGSHFKPARFPAGWPNRSITSRLGRQQGYTQF